MTAYITWQILRTCSFHPSDLPASALPAAPFSWPLKPFYYDGSWFATTLRSRIVHAAVQGVHCPSMMVQVPIVVPRPGLGDPALDCVLYFSRDSRLAILDAHLRILSSPQLYDCGSPPLHALRFVVAIRALQEADSHIARLYHTWIVLAQNEILLEANCRVFSCSALRILTQLHKIGLQSRKLRYGWLLHASSIHGGGKSNLHARKDGWTSYLLVQGSLRDGNDYIHLNDIDREMRRSNWPQLSSNRGGADCERT